MQRTRFLDWITMPEMAEMIDAAGLSPYPSISRCEDYCKDLGGWIAKKDHSIFAKTLVAVWIESETN